VQVGVDDATGRWLDADHPPDGDVLLERDLQVVDLVAPTGDGILTLLGDQIRQRRDQGDELVGLGDEVGLRAELHD
jgi:hypothetical protein